VSLEAVAKYGMTTTPLPSIAEGADEEDVGVNAGDEAAVCGRGTLYWYP
jgi:hypothetical protein